MNSKMYKWLLCRKYCSHSSPAKKSHYRHSSIPSFFFRVSNIAVLPQPPSIQGVVVHTSTWYFPTGSLQQLQQQHISKQHVRDVTFLFCCCHQSLSVYVSAYSQINQDFIIPTLCWLVCQICIRTVLLTDAYLVLLKFYLGTFVILCRPTAYCVVFLCSKPHCIGLQIQMYRSNFWLATSWKYYKTTNTMNVHLSFSAHGTHITGMF